VVLYLGFLGKNLHFHPSTLSRRVAAIAWKHDCAGLPNPRTPSVRGVLAGARRTSTVGTSKKAAISVPELLQISEQLASEEGAQAARDRAMILLCFACAFRRSDIALLKLQDIDLTPEGVTVVLRRSKTDQAGEGRTLVIPLANNPKVCPVLALKSWLVERGPSPGPLFLRIQCRSGAIVRKPVGGHVVWYALKEAARRAGLDPRRFGAHSLRSGAATAAADNGADIFEIMALTGHKRFDTAYRYVQQSHSKYALRKAL
jgi:integrase